VRQQLGPDSLPVVGDADLDVRFHTFQAHINVSAAGRKLGRVVHQVPDHLLEPLPIAGDQAGVDVQPALQREMFRLGGGGHSFEHTVYQGGQVERSDVQAQFAGDDCGYVEQIRNQLRLDLGIAFDRRQAALNLRVVVDLVLEPLGPQQDRVQRGAQLVR